MEEKLPPELEGAMRREWFTLQKLMRHLWLKEEGNKPCHWDRISSRN